MLVYSTLDPITHSSTFWGFFSQARFESWENLNNTRYNTDR